MLSWRAANFAYLSAMKFDYEGRLRRLRKAMVEKGINAVLLSLGPDLPYFTGYEAHPTERLTMAAITEANAALFVPRLEAPKVADSPMTLRAWDETDDPVALVAEAVGRRPEVLAIGEQTWSVFTLALQERFPTAQWLGASEVTRELRIRKDEAEVKALATAAAQADAVARRLPEEVGFAGSTESRVSARIREMLVEEGHDQSLFAIVASGPNGASPHHDPANRTIQPGELVVCDFGGSVGGYRSDTTRTMSVGEPSSRQREVHGVVLSAQSAAQAAVRPGVTCEEIDRIARGVITEAGYGEWFVHRTGHGIGLDVHEDPYLVQGNARELEEGMAFSIEPGIYLPGEFGVRIEDIVVCGGEGARMLNGSPRDLAVVG